jgi:MFS family permease
VLQHFRQLHQKYPRQFWLLFWGMLISSSGNSMIWPFLTVFLTQNLNIALTTATALLTIKSVTTLIASLVAGPLTDRFGRKKAMVLSMGASSLIYILMGFGKSLPIFALLMAASGLVEPLYRIGTNAMLADLLPSQQRAEGYSLMRMINNVGIAIGPMVGGFMAATSYTATFFIGAGCLAVFTLIVIFWIRETLDRNAIQTTNLRQDFQEYPKVFGDKLFMNICLGFTLTMMGAVQFFVLLAVYAKTHHGMPESQFGIIVAANALMVVFLQYAMTQFTKKRPPLPMMAIGALLYAIGLGSTALGSNFWHFLASMIVMTTGELMLVPTTTTLIANLAPPHMRGRYMSIYSLTFGMGQGIGPVIGGFLYDNLAPVSIWYGAMLMPLASAVVFYSLKSLYAKQVEQVPA